MPLTFSFTTRSSSGVSETFMQMNFSKEGSFGRRADRHLAKSVRLRDHQPRGFQTAASPVPTPESTVAMCGIAAPPSDHK
jgi:hypothetical protein